MDTKEALNSFELDARLFYDAVAFSTDDYLYIIDMQRDVALVSDNMREDFGLPDSLVPGLIPLWRDLIVERDRTRFDESIDDMLSGKTNVHDVEYQVKNILGESIWVVCRGLLKRDESGTPTMFAGVVTCLERKGKIDPVTGLFTHDECIDLVERLIGCESEGGVMLLGLDDFSRINSLNGHAFGNTVLRMFAQSTQRLIPEGASMFRLDGDVYAIVVDGADRSAMRELYHAIHVVANRPHTVDDVTFFCMVSAGVAMIGQDATTAQDLLRNAENALEESKLRGKNTMTFFSSTMTATKLRRLEISDYMQTSVLDGMKSFELYYQPLVDAGTMGLAGAEALLRWNSDEHGQLSPVEFIPVLESYGLIGQVGRWVLEQSFAQCKRWTETQPGFIMDVNISYLQLLDADFIPFVERLIERTGVDPESIVLEMTESYFVTDMDALRATFDRLRAIGIRIAMDDFGTGYSSLGLLSQSPADIVKIDRLFIKNIHEETFNRAFIDAVIDLCHSVGIKVTVEGVEESTELDAVRAIGADSIQGFLVSRPIPAQRFEERFLTPQATS
ncbi:putative bifunctional diguanylate cyclase/phosphodiesterase [Eggerthella timonensis]|uniref:putative bifunctional diguanylate cyclase/phosphodiesterase n=1 Tax=Eggerthella timonensis TaxID=1871008 RepID=UPI000C78DC5F|nr:GGDEF and EAL domain-containing protein [Eggerthella timonensis]